MLCVSSARLQHSFRRHGQLPLFQGEMREASADHFFGCSRCSSWCGRMTIDRYGTLNVEAHLAGTTYAVYVAKCGVMPQDGTHALHAVPLASMAIAVHVIESHGSHCMGRTVSCCTVPCRIALYPFVSYHSIPGYHIMYKCTSCPMTSQCVTLHTTRGIKPCAHMFM